jgi:hypothetical protein
MIEPHLFVHMFGSVWLALPDHCLALRRGAKIRYNRSRLTLDRIPDDDTIGRWLMAELGRRGPSRAVDLRDRALREFRGGIQATSIGAVMLMNPAFIRLVPVFLATGAFYCVAEGKRNLSRRILWKPALSVFCHGEKGWRAYGSLSCLVLWI